MVIITIKPKIKGQQYTKISLDDKLKELILEDEIKNKSVIVKIICKEFEIDPEEINKYWIANFK